MRVQTLLPARSNESRREYCWQNILSIRPLESPPAHMETSLGVSGACSELTELSLVEFVIGGARIGLRKADSKDPAYTRPLERSPKVRHPVADLVDGVSAFHVDPDEPACHRWSAAPVEVEPHGTIRSLMGGGNVLLCERFYFLAQLRFSRWCRCDSLL
jgi:hypothetical protein